MAKAEVAPGGELSIEGRTAGRIQGFRFTPETGPRPDLGPDDGVEIAQAIALEYEARADRLSEAVDAALVLANDGAIRWLGEPVAKIASGAALLAPQALILADEAMSGEAQRKAQTRIDLWLEAYVRRLLGPLLELETGVGLEGPARVVAQQLVESLGVLERGRVAQEVKALDQNARGMLRKLGVRFGAYYIYIPSLVKPAIRVLATQLWALRQGASPEGVGLQDIPQMAASGRTSFLADGAVPKETYRIAGFRLCGDRAVRVDIVERLADLIRPAVAYRGGVSGLVPPPGSADGDGFVVTGAMTSLTGCSGEQFASVLRSLGFVSHLVKPPALTPAPPPSVNAATGDAVAETSSATGEAGQPTPDATAPPGEAAARSDGDLAEVAASGPAEAIQDAAVAESIEEAAPPAAPGDQQALAAATPEEGVAMPLAEPETAADTSGEPALVEVWRPRPPNRPHGPRPGARDRTGHASPENSRPARRPDASEAAPRRRGRPAPARPEAGGAEARPQEERSRYRGDRGSRRPQPPAQEAAPAAGESLPPRPGASKDDRGRRGRDPSIAPAPRREAAVNLDSPFAKLLALKLQLETKGKGG